MFNLNALWTELHFVDKRNEPFEPSLLSRLAIAAVLVTAAVTGLAELHVLATFSADDLGSLLLAGG